MQNAYIWIIYNLLNSIRFTFFVLLFLLLLTMTTNIPFHCFTAHICYHTKLTTILSHWFALRIPLRPTNRLQFYICERFILSHRTLAHARIHTYTYNFHTSTNICISIALPLCNFPRRHLVSLFLFTQSNWIPLILYPPNWFFYIISNSLHIYFEFVYLFSFDSVVRPCAFVLFGMYVRSMENIASLHFVLSIN